MLCLYKIPMSFDGMIQSRVSDIFQPQPNAVLDLIHATNLWMNSNTVLLKGITQHSIQPDNVVTLLNRYLGQYFLNAFLEFDRLIKHFDYHQWSDVSAGFVPSIDHIVKTPYTITAKSLDYSEFRQRLYWMLREVPTYHDTQRISHENALSLIQKALVFMDISDTWHFYNIAPDFLYSTGYWQAIEEPPHNAYFDGGTSDSCTFLFHDKTFYLLLTNGSP